MKKLIILMFVIIVMSLFGLATTKAQDTWMAKEGTAKNSELKDAVFNRESIYIATKSALYRTKDIGHRWEPIFALPQGGNNEITCIAGKSRIIFLGTKRGLFRSDDDGHRWINVFRTILPDKNNITYIELSKHNRGRLAIATEKGIFLSDDLGSKWQNISGILNNTVVKRLALNKEYMYAGAESGLYARKMGAKDWERILVKNTAEKAQMEESQDISESEHEDDTSIKTIAIEGVRVYIGYSKKITYSDDNGKSWSDFSCTGLTGEINHILVSTKNKSIYCATRKGIFEFNTANMRWLELYKGMPKSANAKRLIFGSEDENLIFAVTDSGLYSMQSGDYIIDKYPDIGKSLNIVKMAFDGEPTYKELQQAAIRYAEVGPEKIKRWRMESKAKALLPKVSISADKDSSNTYEIYTSATKDYIINGPEDVSRGWNASISWELSDFIWSDDQTNIDVRSRLTTQLRNDILDDLRRAYYERKRLQFELISSPPKDVDAKLEKELRLQELTQTIDDLTGNYFSEHFKKQK